MDIHLADLTWPKKVTKQALRDIDRLKSCCLTWRPYGGTTSPEKEREIHFCAVLRARIVIEDESACSHHLVIALRRQIVSLYGGAMLGQMQQH